MTLFLSNRNGNGKTSEEGHYKFPVNAFSGNVLSAADLVVTQQSPLSRGVTVAAGQYRIPDTSGNFAYTGWNDSPANVNISTADPANPRISAIVLWVDKDAPTSASPPDNPGIVKLSAVNGIPASSPTAPSVATIQAAVNNNPYIILATARVNAAATTVINAQITDTRTMVTLASNLVGTNSLMDSSVTSAKLADASVLAAKIPDAGVGDAKWRNGVSFYARRSSARTFSAQTQTKLAADTIAWNIGSAYSNASDIGRFVAPYAGIYYFAVSLYCEAATQTRAFVVLQKNGSDTQRFGDLTTTVVRRVNGGCYYMLNQGDYVEAFGWLNVSANVANADTNFSGHLVTRV